VVVPRAAAALASTAVAPQAAAVAIPDGNVVAPLVAAAFTAKAATAAQVAGAAGVANLVTSAGVLIAAPLIGVAGWKAFQYAPRRLRSAAPQMVMDEKTVEKDRKASASTDRAPEPNMTATMESASVSPEPNEPPAPPPLPAIRTMRVGDKTLAGDWGFDPLSISDTPESLAWYREAEIRHARLAMLAAFGWPVSEILNFGNLLTKDGRAPALLNGGLDNVNGVYWVAVFALAVAAEKFHIDSQFGKKEKYLPGMLGFDPLGLDSPSTRNAEILNGRVAMVAITAYALEEAIFRSPIFPINLFH
jgi:hypothetical protein